MTRPGALDPQARHPGGMVAAMTSTSPTGGGPGTNQHRVRGRSTTTPRASHHRPASDIRVAAAAEMQNVTFDEDYLLGADLSDRDVRGAQFLLCDADGIDMRRSDARNALFFNTRCRGADFRGADIRGAHFVGCDTTGTRFDGAIYDSSTRLDLPDRTKESAGMVLAPDPAPVR